MTRVPQQLPPPAVVLPDGGALSTLPLVPTVCGAAGVLTTTMFATSSAPEIRRVDPWRSRVPLQRWTDGALHGGIGVVAGRMCIDIAVPCDPEVSLRRRYEWAFFVYLQLCKGGNPQSLLPPLCAAQHPGRELLPITINRGGPHPLGHWVEQYRAVVAEDLVARAEPPLPEGIVGRLELLATYRETIHPQLLREIMVDGATRGHRAVAIAAVQGEPRAAVDGGPLARSAEPRRRVRRCKTSPKRPPMPPPVAPPPSARVLPETPPVSNEAAIQGRPSPASRPPARPVETQMVSRPAGSSTESYVQLIAIAMAGRRVAASLQRAVATAVQGRVTQMVRSGRLPVAPADGAERTIGIIVDQAVSYFAGADD